MSIVRLVLLGALALVRSASGGVAQGPIVDPADGHIYYLLQSTTWTNSESQALSLGGTLATVNNQAENTWILDTFGTTAEAAGDDLWIGLHDPTTGDGTGAQHKADFVWADGETVAFTNWAAGEPNNDPNFGGEYFASLATYAHSGFSPGEWNDKSNSSSGVPSMGVVEVAPEPAAVGIAGAAGLMALRLRKQTSRSDRSVM